jgi:putative transposase
MPLKQGYMSRSGVAPFYKIILWITGSVLLDHSLYTEIPFYGARRMVEALRLLGYDVNQKRVTRLMRKMGIEALYPKPNLSKPDRQHKIFPYLLRGVPIVRTDHVWSTDITYIRLKQGFLYLVAIIDWYSRFVLSWELSNSMEASFCLSALERAFRLGRRPDIFNTDQGSQFTCHEFTTAVLSTGAMMSMDGRGRALDNVFVERLWRTVKQEEVYLKDYQTVTDAYRGLARFFKFYNSERLHSALDYRTPQAVYLGGDLAA